MSQLDFTHDPQRRSFVDVPEGSDFPLQNLPFGVFSMPSRGPRCGVALGDMVVDLSELETAGLLPALGNRPLFSSATLNAFAALGKGAWRTVRQRLSELLDENEPVLRDNPALRNSVVVPRDQVTMHLPMAIGDYTDFYSSREHATNVGTMFRGKDNALQPNWLHLPVAYHGRASSIVVSGTPVRRPSGQTRPDDARPPVFGPSKAVDFELEMGFFVGPGNRLGEPIDVAAAEDRIFGLVLVNDWSARDIQRWEYVPLGPFLSKNFATSISPWIVTLDALEPFRCQGPAQDPVPLEYLQLSGPHSFDVRLEVSLATPALAGPGVISRSNLKYLYWNFAQQLAHHTVTGCNMRPGDLLATGTISGPSPGSYGSMLELAWRGERPLELAPGETRSMLQDGDEVIFRGQAVRDDLRIGFGEVRGTVQPAG